MGEYHIVGGNKIQGSMRVYGAKNAILPILASTVLVNGESIIHDCPMIADTYLAIDILKSIGCTVKQEKNTLIINSQTANKSDVPAELVRKMRSSIIFLGGILGRFNEVKISYPGGCELGARPIDLHLKAIKELGGHIEEEEGFLIATADKLIGNTVVLDFPSVGATENCMLAAVLAEGETVIRNAAKEPEIVDLESFLNSAGAKIVGGGTDKIVIQGVEKLNNVEHYCMPDRIVAGTMLLAAGITGGEILLENIIQEHMYPIVNKIRDTGASIIEVGSRIHFKSAPQLKSIEVLRTHPHPGFPDINKGRQFYMFATLCFISSLKVPSPTTPLPLSPWLLPPYARQ